MSIEKPDIPNDENLKALLAEIIEILSGIDATETDSDAGWWETSAGAEFGSNKLQQIKELFNRNK